MGARPVLRAWSTPPNMMAAARSQPDGRRKGFTIRVYATGMVLLDWSTPTPDPLGRTVAAVPSEVFMRALPVAVLVLSGAALSAQQPSQAAPQPPPQSSPLRAATGDRAGATAVVVDVVVRDSRGKPVVSLGG